MNQIALIVECKTMPNSRDEARKAWDMRMPAAVTANPGHAAYFSCFDTADPISICAFQLYSRAQALQEFLKTDS